MNEAMYELYRAYYEDLYRFVSQVEAGHGDVDALVQEVLVVANRHYPQYRGECGYKAWLFAVAYQHLKSPWRNLLRGRKGQPEEIAQVLPADLEDDERERRRLLRELNKLFAELPRRERDVLVLRDLHEFSVRETGIILQVIDEKVRVWTELALDKVKERFPQPEQYQRALRLLREMPSEAELRLKKAAMWEAFAATAQRAQRRTKRRPVIWGAVGVAVVAAGVLGWREFQGSQLAEQATTAPAVLQPVQTTVENGRELFGVKRVDLGPQRRDLKTVNNRLLIENRTFQIEDKDGKRTPLVQLDVLDEFHMMDFEGPYAAFVIYKPTGDYGVYRMNLEKKTADLIPTEHLNVVMMRFWPGAHGVALLLADRETGGQSVMVYDWDIGKATSLFQSKEFTYNRLDTRGENLVLASERVIAVKSPNGRWQGVANSLEPTLRYMRMTDDYLLYMDGTDGNLDINGVYRGTTRVKKYDLHTGATAELLPGVEGEQWLLNEFAWPEGEDDKFGIFVGNFVLTETVADDSGPPPVLKGLQQIWRVLPNGERTKVYESPERWDRYGLQMFPGDPASDQLVIQPRFGDLPTLFYNVKTGAVTPSTK